MNISLESADLGTPKLHISTKISKWEKYEYTEINNTKYIRGVSSREDSKLFEYKDISNPEILLALLSLKTKLSVNFNISQKNISDNITNEDIDLTINFCKKYGMPFWGVAPKTNYCKNGVDEENCNTLDIILRKLIPFAKENYFHIASFIQAVHWLYTDFLRIAVSNDWHKNNDEIKRLIKNDLNIAHKIELNQKKDAFHTHLFLPNKNPFFTYWNNEELRLELSCENLIHLSTYYLCVMQETNFPNGYIKQCKRCGQFFLTSQSRQKFCNNPCTRQSYYAAQQRKSNTR